MGQAKLKKGKEFKSNAAYLDDLLPVKLLWAMLYEHHAGQKEPDDMTSSGFTEAAMKALDAVIEHELSDMDYPKRTGLKKDLKIGALKLIDYLIENKYDSHKGMITSYEWILSLQSTGEVEFHPDVLVVVEALPDVLESDEALQESARKHVKKLHEVARMIGFY